MGPKRAPARTDDALADCWVQANAFGHCAPALAGVECAYVTKAGMLITRPSVNARTHSWMIRLANGCEGDSARAGCPVDRRRWSAVEVRDDTVASWSCKFASRAHDDGSQCSGATVEERTPDVIGDSRSSWLFVAVGAWCAQPGFWPVPATPTNTATEWASPFWACASWRTRSNMAGCRIEPGPSQMASAAGTTAARGKICRIADQALQTWALRYRHNTLPGVLSPQFDGRRDIC